jgi:hypothetical protein
MKNIHILPTQNPSRLWLSTRGNPYLIFDKFARSGVEYVEPQHIYITSDEEIKEGWFIDTKRNLVSKYKRKEIGTSNKIPILICEYEGCYIEEDCKKIILTTVQGIIKDGVQAIDDTFLEWFVKNPTCEHVDFILEDVEQPRPLYPNGKHKGERVWFEQYKIIIPKKQTKEEKNFEDMLDESLTKTKIILEELKDINAKQKIPVKNNSLLQLMPYLKGFIIGMLTEYCIRVELTPLPLFILTTTILSVIIVLKKK